MLDIMVVSQGVVEVRPAVGAEKAVEICGGVANVLQLVNVDLETALKTEVSMKGGSQSEHNANKESIAAESDLRRAVSQTDGAVQFKLAHYHVLKGALHAAKKLLDGIQLLPRGGGIPEPVLSAFR